MSAEGGQLDRSTLAQLSSAYRCWALLSSRGTAMLVQELFAAAGVEVREGGAVKCSLGLPPKHPPKQSALFQRMNELLQHLPGQRRFEYELLPRGHLFGSTGRQIGVVATTPQQLLEFKAAQQQQQQLEEEAVGRLTALKAVPALQQVRLNRTSLKADKAGVFVLGGLRSTADLLHQTMATPGQQQISCLD